MMPTFPKIGLDALLTPENCALLLIDHQPSQLANVDSHDVYAVTDASGGVTPEAHDMAIRRLVAAGAQPVTWLGMAGELQRDWARMESLGAVAQILFDHAGASGTVLAWELANEGRRA